MLTRKPEHRLPTIAAREPPTSPGTYVTFYTWVQNHHILPLTNVVEPDKIFIKPISFLLRIQLDNIFQPSLQQGVTSRLNSCHQKVGRRLAPSHLLPLSIPVGRMEMELWIHADWRSHKMEWDWVSESLLKRLSTKHLS